MSRAGRIRITGSRPRGRTLRGQDIIIQLLDEDGVARLIPVLSAQLVLCADGRKHEVTCRLIVPVAELSIDVDAELSSEQ